MTDHRWGFEEDDDWEDAGWQRAAPSQAPAAEPADTITGVDPDGAVTVAVGPDAEVLSVALSANWTSVVDPRALHNSVRAAANNATMQALARRMDAEQPAQLTPPATPQPAPTATPAAGRTDDDERRITKEDAMRLMDAVTVELDRFTRNLAEVTDQQVTAESDGRHVSGSAMRGQVVEISIDANWAASARSSEIETELLDVLRRLHRKSTPAELAAGPQGSAIAELNALLSDPQKLLRRVGLLPAPSVSTPRGNG